MVEELAPGDGLLTSWSLARNLELERAAELLSGVVPNAANFPWKWTCDELYGRDVEEALGGRDEWRNLVGAQTALNLATLTAATELSRSCLLGASHVDTSPPPSRGEKFLEWLRTLHSGSPLASAGVAPDISVRQLAWYLDALPLDRFELEPLSTCLYQVKEAVEDFLASRSLGEEPPWDYLGELYRATVPQRVRHVLGEYYTPKWLVDLLLEECGYEGKEGQTFLDPSCGTGVVLLGALRKGLEKRHPDSTDSINRLLSDVVGIEVNPLAAAMAKVNQLFLLADNGALKASSTPLAPRVIVGSVLDANLGVIAECVAGNPPWVNWELLPERFRVSTRSDWKDLGLFALEGIDCLLGGGRKDLALLVVATALVRHTKVGGRASFVFPAHVFRNVAGGGFRRMRFGGVHVRIDGVHDFSQLEPFPGATTKSLVVTFTVGSPTKFPITTVEWSSSGEVRRPPADGSWTRVRANLASRKLHAHRVFPEDPASPFAFIPTEVEGVRHLLAPSDYKAREGVNPLGAQGVFLLRLLGKPESSGSRVVEVRNVTRWGKRKLPNVTATLEAELIYPCVTSGAVGPAPWLVKWSGELQTFFLLTQDPVKQRGLDEKLFPGQYPHAHVYLEALREPLLERKGLWRYFSKGGRLSAPYYSVFNVTTDSLAPYKVAWKRMGTRFAAVVLEPVGHPALGPEPKPVLPLDVFAFVPCGSLNEALFVAGVLNSRFARALLSLVTQPGKSIASPSVLSFLNLRTYDENDPVHAEVVAAAARAHEAARLGGVPGDALVVSIDSAAARYYESVSPSPALVRKIYKGFREE
ncbi:MAG: hypothetical protein Kow0069_10980 [Promethearchaeota archaeon]